MSARALTPMPIWNSPSNVKPMAFAARPSRPQRRGQSAQAVRMSVAAWCTVALASACALA